ncbi:MAG: MFS transporter [Actinobacteria bacterium]|nr:MAG: MFS transporter [Actinomycetota bacterium]
MEGIRDRARAVLAVRDFRLLLATRLLSQFADGIFQAFLIDRLVFLSAEKGTTVSVAKAFALLVIPFSVIGPLSGVVIDRWSRRAILVVTALIRAVAALALLGAAGSHANGALYFFALVIVSLNRFFLATAGAVMPALVPDKHLLTGNSLSAAFGTVISFAGLIVGTQIADGVGPRGLLVFTVVCWPVAALLGSRIVNPLRPERRGAGLTKEIRRVTVELGRGARRLLATPPALGAILSVSFDQLLIGLITVLSVVVFKHEFRQGVASYGRIVGAGGAGVLIGSATVGWFEGRLDKPRIMSLAFALAGVACVVGSVRIFGPSILLISFTLGLTYPWRKVPADTLVQHSIPDRFRGRVFALYDMAFAMPRVIAAALAIPLIPRLSSRLIVALVGLAYLAWTPVPPWWVRRPRWVDLRFYAGARADEVPRSMVIAGDEEPIEVVASSFEEAADGTVPVRTRRLRLRTSDGSILDVAEDQRRGRWRVQSEIGPGEVQRAP